MTLKHVIDNTFSYSFNRFHLKSLPTTIQEFNTLTKHKQQRLFLKKGVIINCWETAKHSIVLSQLNDFYVIAYFDLDCTKIMHCSAYEKKDELQPFFEQEGIAVAIPLYPTETPVACSIR